MNGCEREDRLLRDLARIDGGTRDPGYVLEIVHGASGEVDWGNLLQKAHSNKVLNLVVRRLMDLEQRGEFALPGGTLDALWELRGPRTHCLPRYEALPDSLPPLTRLAAALAQEQRAMADFLSGRPLSDLCEGEQPLLFIKGVPMQLLYPEGVVRDSYDMDMVVPDLRAAWGVMGHLADRGLSFKRMRLQKTNRHRVAGEADAAIPGGGEIDLHLGAFNMVCMSAYDAPYWERAIEHPRLPGGSCLLPSREDLLLIMVGHIRRHGQMMLRDINDCYVLLNQGGEPSDWDYIARAARRNNLGPVLQVLIRRARATYHDLAIPDEDCFSQGRLAYRAARWMMQHAGDGHRYRSLPHIAWHVLRFESPRYGAAAAVRDALGFALVTLERDSRVWHLSAQGHTGGKLLVLALRAVLLRAILHRSWSVSNIRTWFPIDLHPVAAAVDGRRCEVRGLDTAACAAVGTALGADVQIIDGLITWGGWLGDVPELVITPVGIYSAFMYKGGAAREITTGARFEDMPALERQAGTIVKAMMANGVAVTLAELG